ncbi:hypothetical protein IY145_04355 [Methylosinus sp. H3A]|uniref:hypothetical protein n=1 Tax=Methylosinus sp. H3A TaxID=2785786 RepID=UPI0018C2C3C2|nr:hypothetical protein [Methylosinus sp. H3A]MBG0808601.1 hypothetical protein [Methylosinus sp. H3A]
MARSVAFYLPRFDEGPKIIAPEPLPLPIAFDEPELEPEIVAAEPAEDPLPALTDELREQLLEEGRDSAKAECDAKIERERAAFAQRLEEERRRWAREEGERLGRDFRDALGRFSARIGDDVEKILEPFVVREIREQMLVGLLETLRILLVDHENPVVHLSGPVDLLEAICTKLHGEDIATRIDDVGGADVRARLDATTIETRLGEWMAQLREGDDAA